MNSGIRKSRHLWPHTDIHRIPSLNTSCKQPSVSCVESRLAVLLPCDCCCMCLARDWFQDGRQQSSACSHRLSWHTILWSTPKKSHLLHFHYGTGFKQRQSKLIECKCLSQRCQLRRVSHILIRRPYYFLTTCQSSVINYLSQHLDSAQSGKSPQFHSWYPH